MELTRRHGFALAMTVAMLGAPGAALAHGEMLSQEPAADSVSKKPVDHIRINFTEAPSDDATVVVRDGCGTDLVDEVFAQDHTLHVFLSDTKQRGNFDVRYRIVSADDGHVTAGKYSFAVKGEAVCSAPEPEESPDPTEPPGDDDDAGDAAEQTSTGGSTLPLVAFIVGGAALGGIVLLVRTRP